ncbi:MAG: mannose-6-phosphate isomerase, class I [Polyangiaceae bacterium]
MNVSELACKIQNYAWGSRSFIAALQGRATPTELPEAELWIGAHAGAPAEVVEGESRQRLDQLIARKPLELLGADVVRRFDGDLPFLLKVLAAAQPLSLQAHPNSEQARAGFDADEAAHIPLSAPQRSYKDCRHKPELIVALTPFVALTGFRRVERTRQLFAELQSARLSPLLAPLAELPPEAALQALFERLMTSPRDVQQALVQSTLEGAAAALARGSEFEAELRWAARLNQLYPGDIGVVSSLLLNLVELAPFEGLYLPAGNLHAYLDGSGVEIMAASDNVLRGGLTPKAVNVPELLRVLRFRELDVEPLRAKLGEAGEHVYSTSAAEFQLSYFTLEQPRTLATSGGPELLLVSEGRARIITESGALLLVSGSAAFVPASIESITLEGEGRVFRARVAADVA